MRAYILLTLLFLGIVVGNYHWQGRSGLIWGFLFCLFVHWSIFFLGDSQLAQLFKVKKLEGQDPWGLLKEVESLCEKAKIPPPQVFVIKDPVLNAYSVARNHDKSEIFISEELLGKLDRNELRSVLAHEIAKIKNLDTISLSLSSSLMSLGLFPLFLFPLKNSTRIQKSLASAWLHLCSFWVYFIRRLTLHPEIYFSADHMATEWTGDNKSYAQMLWKLDSYNKTKNLMIRPQATPLFIVNPLTKQGWGLYFQAQPSTEERIKKVLGHYPI